MSILVTRDNTGNQRTCIALLGTILHTCINEITWAVKWLSRCTSWPVAMATALAIAGGGQDFIVAQEERRRLCAWSTSALKLVYLHWKENWWFDDTEAYKQVEMIKRSVTLVWTLLSCTENHTVTQQQQTHLECGNAFMILCNGITYLPGQCQLSITFNTQQALSLTEQLQCSQPEVEMFRSNLKTTRNIISHVQSKQLNSEETGSNANKRCCTHYLGC